MKDDMVTYSKCPRQRMKTIWTLPLKFFVMECILTRKRKIAVIAWVHTISDWFREHACSNCSSNGIRAIGSSVRRCASVSQ